MTEQGWLSCSDPQKMLEFLRGKASERKLRLFAVACCDRIRHLFSGEWKAGVELAESLAEGTVTKSLVSRVRRRLRYNHLTIRESDNGEIYLAKEAVLAALRLRAVPSALDAASAARNAVYRCTEEDADLVAEEQWQADCVRELLPNPIRVISVDPSRLTPTVVTLAQTIYDDRAFDRIPVLADALTDAGCNNFDMLEHCRSGAEHVRGCWAVDLVLGKE